MIFLPPHTVEEKVAALRSCLPGINLYNFLKGMPTALGRSKDTVPRGMSQLREVRHAARHPSALVSFHAVEVLGCRFGRAAALLHETNLRCWLSVDSLKQNDRAPFLLQP